MNDIEKKIKKREYDKKYRLNNPEKIKLWYQERKVRCKELIAKQKRKYNENNIIKIRILGCKNSAIKRGIEFNIDEEYLNSILITQNNKCFYSGIEFVDLDRNYGLSVDRTDNTKGYIKGNIKLICTVVNKMKQTLTEEEFINLIKKIYVKHV